MQTAHGLSRAFLIRGKKGTSTWNSSRKGRGN